MRHAQRPLEQCNEANANSSKTRSAAAVQVLVFCVLTLLSSLGGAAPRARDTGTLTNCTVITQPSSYVLGSNLPGSEGLLSDAGCLSIQASGVSIDLGGFSISGNSGLGIGISDGGTTQRNIHISNGTVTGFSTAIDLRASYDSTVEEIRALDNLDVGIALGPQSVAIRNVVVGNDFGLVVSCPANAIGNSSWNNSTADLHRINAAMCSQSEGLNSLSVKIDDNSQLCTTLGLTTCGDECVNTQKDEQNCGACSASCYSGYLCSAGTCVLSCQLGLAACGGQCVNLYKDEENCGQCGFICASNQRCNLGACQTL